MFETAGVLNALAALTLLGTIVAKVDAWPRWKKVGLIVAAVGCALWASKFYRNEADHVEGSITVLRVACAWLFGATVLCAGLWLQDVLRSESWDSQARSRRAHALAKHR